MTEKGDYSKAEEANEVDYEKRNEQVQRRPPITEKFMEENFLFEKLKADNICRSTGNYLKKNYKPTPNCMKNYFFKRLPIFEWVLNYDIKQCFVKDLIAGLTLGIVHIPQGMAYSMMAGTPAINGLYVSFFSIALYLLFGTSKHLSVGTYAIISLLVRSSLDKYRGILYPAGSPGSPSMVNETHHRMIRSDSGAHSSSPISDMGQIGFIADNENEGKLLIAMTLAILAGIFQIILGVCYIGVVTKYLSDAIVSGFTTGAAYHVVVSQIPSLLGIKLDHEHTPFVIIGEIIQIFKHLRETNFPTLVISFIAILFLYIVKTHVNERFKAKLPAPIPVELIAVVIGTLVAYLVKVDSCKYKVDIIGKLPTGLPAPKLPPMKLFSLLVGDAIPIAIVSFAVNISMAKLFAKRYQYEIRPNQELFSYGIGNVVSGVFHGFPGCVGLSRCAILESVGGKTQAHGVYSALLVLLVALFLGPLFFYLPKAILASIIVVALKHMIIDVKEIVPLVKKSKIEGLGWIISYGGVMILNVDVGLYIGLIASILIAIIKAQRARTSIIGNIPGTSFYECIDVCKNAKEFRGIRIIRYEESVYYVNVDNFKYKVLKLSKINPDEIKSRINSETKQELGKLMKLLKQTKKEKDDENKSVINIEGYDFDLQGDLEENKRRIIERVRSKHLSKIEHQYIVLDCSCMNYIDSQGVDCILKLYESFKEIGVNLYLSYCKQAIIKAFKKNSLQEGFDFDRIFVSTQEAILYILSQIRPDLRISYPTKEKEENSDSLPVNVMKESNFDARVTQEEVFAYNF